MFDAWDENDPKDAVVILEMVRRGACQRYVDLMLAATTPPGAGEDVRAGIEGRHQGPAFADLLPLYFPAMHGYWVISRSE
jgi:hypothetical protein